MKIKLFKQHGYLYRPCIFCDGMMIVTMNPDYNDNVIHSISVCKKCRSQIDITTTKDNYTLTDHGEN